MIEVGNTIVSLDVIESPFVCDLSVCKGKCCIQGDEGAPLESEETEILKNIYPIIYPYLSRTGKKAIEKHGLFYQDRDGDWVTMLIDGRQCAYSVMENGIAYCSIEKAFNNNEIHYQKPISCHLYPIRIQKYRDFEALNVDHSKLCNIARQLGKSLETPVYKFTKIPLIRKYGKDWYDQLEYIIEHEIIYPESKNGYRNS